jgi:hypothetical protein
MTLDGIPSQQGPARDAWILDAVMNGRASYTFADVTSEDNGNSAVFQIMDDALKIDGVRVNVSSRLEQQIADVLGCLLMTPKLADLLFLQRATTLVPLPMPITSTTAAMIQESGKIDAAAEKAGWSGGILQTVGKHWVLMNKLLSKPGFGINYGWHFLKGDFGMSGERCVTLATQDGKQVLVIQGPWMAHNYDHVDYSQNCVLVSRDCVVNGSKRDLADVYQDATLAGLASSEGVLQVIRVPIDGSSSPPPPKTGGSGGGQKQPAPPPPTSSSSTGEEEENNDNPDLAAGLEEDETPTTKKSYGWLWGLAGAAAVAGVGVYVWKQSDKTL